MKKIKLVAFSLASLSTLACASFAMTTDIKLGDKGIQLVQTQAVAKNVRNDKTRRVTSGIGGSWGSWSRPVYCPSGSYAAGYTMRVEPSIGRGDDTALNAIALYCRYPNGRYAGRVSPHPGHWGSWREGVSCRGRGNFLTHFQLKVERYQRSGDDTAANSVAFWCSRGKRIEGNGGGWGRWGKWKGGYYKSAICGVAAKVEPPQGSGDDTALNDLEFTWCRL
ncbi:MAG: hypothetical protein KI793_05590 [Rivularia sp. (in: Bacteria)]|nr:hypothetical protein [Rivularia sp. MS3]